MKTRYKIMCMLVVALTGCAATKPSLSGSGTQGNAAVNLTGEELQSQVNTVQKKLNDCIAKVNETDDAKFINAHVLSLAPNNPNAKDLFKSTEKLSPEQAAVLARFKESTTACRSISQEFPNPALVDIYANFYKQIDAVYADLLAKRITIGVANQERAMRIQYARSQWVETMKAQKGS